MSYPDYENSYFGDSDIPLPTFGGSTNTKQIDGVIISQPQLYRINSILRGTRDTATINYEMQAIAYDIYKLYYKQNVIEHAFYTDIAYIYTGNDTPQYWDSRIVYALDEKVFWSHVWYRSLANNNQNQQPDTHALKWVSISETGRILEDAPADTTDTVLLNYDAMLASIVDIDRRIMTLENATYSDL